MDRSVLGVEQQDINRLVFLVLAAIAGDFAGCTVFALHDAELTNNTALFVRDIGETHRSLSSRHLPMSFVGT
jgi:hypothetical protein